MLSFGLVVAANNLVALNDFNTFLFNMEIHEQPGFINRKIIAWAKKWIANRAVKQFKDLLDREIGKYLRRMYAHLSDKRHLQNITEFENERKN